MRLPWIQLTEDGDRRSRSFGQLIGIGGDAGVGFVTRIWRAALDLAPPGNFEGAFEDPALLVAHAGGNSPGCTAEPARVVELLQKVGLSASDPGLRVRGLDRYEPTWRKNNKSPKTHDHPRGSRGETEPEPARKTETETETETENDRSDPSAGKARKPSRAQELAEIMERDRVERCLDVGVEPGKPEKIHPAKLNAMMGAAIDRTSAAEVVAIYAHQYLHDDFGKVDARTGKARTPPWPLALFFSANIFEKYRAAFAESPEPGEVQ